MTWAEDVQAALKRLGGRAHLSAIYKDVRAARTKGGRTVPPNLESAVRDALERHSSDSDLYDTKREDLFQMAEGKGAGIWALR